MKELIAIIVMTITTSTAFAYKCNGSVSNGDKVKFIGKEIKDTKAMVDDDFTLYEDTDIIIRAALEGTGGAIQAFGKEIDKDGKLVLVALADSSASGLITKSLSLTYSNKPFGKINFWINCDL